MFENSPTQSSKEIRLPCGKVAIVSRDDYERVSLLSWSDRGGGYIRARFKKSAGGDGKSIYLHRFITNAPNGFDVDHIDGNPLNNTRGNLQVITRSRNIMRAYIKKNGISKYRGKWRVRMRIDGRAHCFGCFDSESDAQKAVNLARILAWDEDRLNTDGVKP